MSQQTLHINTICNISLYAQVVSIIFKMIQLFDEKHFIVIPIISKFRISDLILTNETFFQDPVSSNRTNPSFEFLILSATLLVSSSDHIITLVSKIVTIFCYRKKLIREIFCHTFISLKNIYFQNGISYIFTSIIEISNDQQIAQCDKNIWASFMIEGIVSIGYWRHVLLMS